MAELKKRRSVGELGAALSLGTSKRRIKVWVGA